MSPFPIFRRRKQSVSSNSRPSTAIEPATPAPEIPPHIRPRVARTVHDMVVYEEGTSHGTTLAEAMQVPPNRRWYSHQISGLAQNPAMIFAEPQASDHESQQGGRVSQSFDTEVAGSSSEDSGSESTICEVRDDSTEDLVGADESLPTEDAQSIRSSEDSHSDSEVRSLRDTPRKKRKEINRQSVAHSESSISEGAEIPTEEELARILIISPAQPLLRSNRETSVLGLRDREDLPQDKGETSMAEITAYIDEVLELYRSTTGEEAAGSANSTEIYPAASNIMSSNQANSMRHQRPQYPPEPPLISPRWTTHSSSIESPRPMRSTQLYRDPIGRRPMNPVNVGRARPAAPRRAGPYYPGERAGPNFRGKWNYQDFGPCPKGTN